MRTFCICKGKTYNLRKSQVSFVLKLFSDCKCGFSRNQSVFLQMRSSSGFETSSSEVVFCFFSCTKTEVTVNQLFVLRCARLLPPAGLERHYSTDQTDWKGLFSFLWFSIYFSIYLWPRVKLLCKLVNDTDNDKCGDTNEPQLNCSVAQSCCWTPAESCESEGGEASGCWRQPAARLSGVCGAVVVYSIYMKSTQ